MWMHIWICIAYMRSHVSVSISRSQKRKSDGETNMLVESNLIHITTFKAIRMVCYCYISLFSTYSVCCCKMFMWAYSHFKCPHRFKLQRRSIRILSLYDAHFSAKYTEFAMQLSRTSQCPCSWHRYATHARYTRKIPQNKMKCLHNFSPFFYIYLVSVWLQRNLGKSHTICYFPTTDWAYHVPQKRPT